MAERHQLKERSCATLFQAAHKLLILKRRDGGVVDRARLENVALRFTPQVARAADNVGCEPPQIPLSKSLKTKRLQSVADWDAI